MTKIKKTFETRCLSSLAKVFPDDDIIDPPFQNGTALWNEIYSFQVAYRINGQMLKGINVEVISSITDNIQIRSVGLVPSEFPIYHDHDEHILRSTPGLYPDPLFPIADDGLTAFPNQWRSVWVTVDVNKSMAPGVHPIHIVFKTSSGTKIAEEVFTLEIIPFELPKQRLIHTQWFHVDCLADQYGVPVFSEPHWELIDQYVKTATDHGINMLLTPLFTPPLDTEIGSERPTVQLVDVEKTGDYYRFSFDKLSRWIELCTSRGVEYFEFSHLFTQWGAYHAPKIVASVNGIDKKIFGWETDANGEDYKDFLSQFLPKLVEFIKQHKLDQRVYFHVSDEPSLEHIKSYKNARDIIHHYLAEFPIIDAVSDYAYYENGLVNNPIPATDHIEQFINNNVPNLWTYYCCSQYKKVSNRFFCFPSARNRIIGMQLYKFDIKGFLHWGYNFWFSQLSRSSIDPFQNTDAGYGFPSGDAFMVYPGKNGPIESLRMEVFYEALQDLRALKLLETTIGKEQVISLIEHELTDPLTFNKFPINNAWLLGKREEINRKIVETCIQP